MKYRIKKNTFLLKLWFFVVLLLNMDCFGIVVMPSFWYSINSIGHKSLIIALSLLMVPYCLNYKLTNIQNSTWKKIRKYILTITLCTVFVFIYSLIIYKQQSVFDTFRVMERLLVVFSSVPIFYLICKDGKSDWIFHAIEITAFLYLIIVICQYVLSDSGIILMKSYYAMNTVGVRNGSVRIPIDYLLNILAIYEFDRVINKKNNNSTAMLKHIVLLILLVFVIVFIQKTRALTAAVACGCLITLLFSKKNIKRFIRIVIIIVSFILLLISTDIVNNIISSFDGSLSEYSFSSTNRIGALAYFWTSFINNPIFGNGFISDATKVYQSILKGPLGSYYLTDVGVIGLLAEMGMFGVLVFSTTITFFINCLRKIHANKCDFEFSYLYGFFVFFLVTSLSLIITDGYRIFSLPILICLFAYGQWYSCTREFKNE